MPFVLDASTAIAWAFEDERGSRATLALDRLRADEAMVPGIWWYEVRNALIVSERRGRLAEAETAAFLRQLARLPVIVDHGADEPSVLGFARQHRLTVYDAAYLELARRVAMPLATLDGDLVRAARAENVALLE